MLYRSLLFHSAFRISIVSINVHFFLTPVVPPSFKVNSTGGLVSQAPLVKSGTSIEFKRLATNYSLCGAIALQSAASHTSSSSGSPLRRQSISRQSIIKSIPPCPSIFLAILPIFFTISDSFSILLPSPKAILKIIPIGIDRAIST